MGKHLAVKFPVLASTAGNALSKQSVEPRGEARGKEQDNGGRWAEAEVVCTAQFGRVAVPCRLLLLHECSEDFRVCSLV